MITLSADNRSLLTVAPYTFLVDNVAAGAIGFDVVNVEGFHQDDLILVASFGNEDAELFRVGSVDHGRLTLLDKNGSPTQTRFPHSESTRVTVVPFNEIRFYWTPATGTIADEDPEFSMASPLTDWLDVLPSEWFTNHVDADHSTGFGWFLFRNSVSLEASQPSNAIPYGGFAENSVKTVFSDFTSLLNNRELKLITTDDMYSWINEGISVIRNKLNLSNPEYTVSAETPLVLVPDVQEYMLPADFADLVEIIGGEDARVPIPMVKISEAMVYRGAPRYYIRGRYIGIVPTPKKDNTYSFRYRSRGSRVKSYDDLIDLPDGGFEMLKDWMMYRANLKCQNPNAATYYKAFTDSLNMMIASSVKRDANLDSWGIARNAIV